MNVWGGIGACAGWAKGFAGVLDVFFVLGLLWPLGLPSSGMMRVWQVSCF